LLKANKLNLELLLILGLVAMVAGFIDAIAGGGGLITLPALLLSGVPPVSAIATNKLQAASATLSATISFARKGLIEWRKAIPIACMSFLGGTLGALSVTLMPKNVLLTIVPILLILVALYFIFSPKLSDVDKKPLIPYFLFALVVAPLLGFYDGVFGPGVGSFFIVAFVLLLGFKLVSALSYTKLANVACNLGSLSIFIIKGYVIFPIALVMACGAFIGASIGAKFAVRFGSRVIKPLLILISLCMALKLLLDHKNPIFIYFSHFF
jgi:hypothetical protein